MRAQQSPLTATVRGCTFPLLPLRPPREITMRYAARLIQVAALLTCLSLTLISSPATAVSTTQSRSNDDAKPQYQLAAGGGYCTGHTYMANDELVQAGNRFLGGTADQTCALRTAYTQQLCAKLQKFTGGPNGQRVDVRTWDCNTNTGTSISATAVRACSSVGPGTYRTGARGTVYPVGQPSQRRYGYSASRNLC